MNPTILSRELTRIATALEKSASPDWNRVRNDVFSLRKAATDGAVLITPGRPVNADGERINIDSNILALACDFFEMYFKLSCEVVAGKIVIYCDGEADCNATRDLLNSMLHMDSPSNYPEGEEKDAAMLVLDIGAKIE